MSETGDIRIDEMMPLLCDVWPILQFEECLLPALPILRKLKSKEIESSGAIPVIDQAESFISGYTNDQASKYLGPLPVIIFGDHTRRFKYVDFAFAVGAEGTHLLHPIRELEPKFFYHYLSALNLESQGYSRHYKFLKEAFVPIPSIAEQQRIVAKLEVLLGKVDACRKRLEKIPVILKRFRQSVLAAACSGRLTADWREENPNVESAEMLIDRISNERRRRHGTLHCTHGTSRKKALADYDNFDPALRGDLELPDLPETWRWVDLRFLMSPEEAFCYGVVQPGEDDHAGPRLVRVCDLGGGRVRIPDLRGITAKVHSQYERSVISGGEVLISVVGTIGRAAIAPTELKGANIARAVAKIPIREFEARYFLLWLTTSRAETWMVGDAREVARKTLNLEQLRTLPTPLPPIPEQQEIVRRVDALFAVADQIETRYAKAKTHADRLTQSILAKAFRGDLVPQDANDEPASVLLERIRSQRQETGAPRRQLRRTGGLRKQN